MATNNNRKVTIGVEYQLNQSKWDYVCIRENSIDD